MPETMTGTSLRNAIGDAIEAATIPEVETAPAPNTLPLVYTNQQLIDAFFDAANTLDGGDYQGLLARAGLDINQLAADRSGRYRGQPPSELPQLSEAEREGIHQSLLRQLQRSGKRAYVNTAEGLNLRAGPSREQAILAALPVGSELTVLSDEGEWLFATAGGQIGWVYATLVSPDPPPGLSEDNTTTTATAFTGSLAPATPLSLPTDATPHMIGAATTWNQYGGLIATECSRLALDPAVAVAILGVESSGRAFEGDRMIIRFENHIFLHYWGSDHHDLFDHHFTGSADGNQHRWRPDPNGEWLPCHTSQANEWQVFEFARRLDERAAMLSISMGAAQIMGFNHTTIGYGTVRAMFEAFQADVRNQLAALFRFIEVNHLEEAVRRADFLTFARTYNGRGQEETYAPRMQRYFDAYRQLTGTAAPESAEAPAHPSLPETLPSTPAIFGGDPELLAAWRKHIASGFANNELMFQQILQDFQRPYWATVWMIYTLFAVGAGSFLLAAGLAIFTDRTSAVLVFGALSAIALLGYVFSRPLQALERSLSFHSWLGLIYNSYWARLVHLDPQADVHQEINSATDDAIERIKALIDTQANPSRPREPMPKRSS
ncbi:MAG: DUF3380 domain-containing protein [Caldilineaceae bacterium]|nr:DUF3380 domain-containing protein [Caldilineaceae bacterium]